MSEDAKAARDRAWRGALAVAQSRRNMAAALLRDAELTTMRRLICAHVVGGEAEYWRQVEEELRR